MSKVVNCTSRPITVRVREKEFVLPPSGVVPRVVTIRVLVDVVGGIPCIVEKLWEVKGLPAPEDGTFFLVDSTIFQSSKRKDLVTPDTKECIKNKEGQIVAITGLVRKW